MFRNKFIEFFCSQRRCIDAKGLREMVEIVRGFGSIVVVAPAEPQSAHVTCHYCQCSIKIRKVKEEDGLVMVYCNGTPWIVVKMAFNQF